MLADRQRHTYKQKTNKQNDYNTPLPYQRRSNYKLVVHKLKIWERFVPRGGGITSRIRQAAAAHGCIRNRARSRATAMSLESIMCSSPAERTKLIFVPLIKLGISRVRTRLPGPCTTVAICSSFSFLTSLSFSLLSRDRSIDRLFGQDHPSRKGSTSINVSVV